MKKLIYFITLLLVPLAFHAQSKQAPEVPSPILFIYDASGSMWGQMEGKTKMEIASSVLSQALDNFAENQPIGLVVYGHREKSNCSDVEFILPLENISKEKVASEVSAIKPLGKTPLAHAATTVINRLRSSQQKATIVLITDGIESCDGDICQVVSEAKKEGIDFKLHIVGFGLKKGETKALECAAKAGDGNYYDAGNAGGLAEALNDVSNQTVDKPRGNHGVYATMNGEPIDVLVSAYRTGTKNRVDGVRTYRDTAYVYLPQERYDLVIRPLENSEVAPIELTGITTSNDQNTYSTVRFDGGTLAVLGTNNGEGWDCTVKIENALGKNIATGRTYGRTKEFEVNQGTYSITIQALKIDGLDTKTTLTHTTVEANQTTAIAHNFETGTLEILPTFQGKIIDCTVKMIETTSGKNVASGRSYNKGVKRLLNPGTYKIEVNALKSSGAVGTKSEVITITSGEMSKKVINF